MKICYFRTLPISSAVAACGCLSALFVVAVPSASANEKPLTFQEVLYSGPVGGGYFRRSPSSTDPVLQRLVSSELLPPHEGDVSGKGFRGGEQHWRKLAIDDSGAITGGDLRGGYLYLTCTVNQDETVVLSPDGISEMFVDGVPRAGDVYGKHRILLPVKLNKGRHELWCKIARGKEKSVGVSTPRKPIYLTTIDPTLPDLLTTESDEKWAAIRIVNATDTTLGNLKLRAEVAGREITTPFTGTVPPMTTRKVPFKIQDAADAAGDQVVHVGLFQRDELIDEADLPIEAKEPSKNFRRTFLSDIDGSVQYYAVRLGKPEAGRKPALFLSLHGAGVKAIAQAGSYQSKDWGHVVAPTNRREFGFDWEDWGRLDALEVLADAEAWLDTDPSQNVPDRSFHGWSRHMDFGGNVSVALGSHRATRRMAVVFLLRKKTTGRG